MLRNLTIDAFAHSPDILAALEALPGHRQLQRCKVTVRPGGIEAAIIHYAGTVTPSVLIIENDKVDRLDGLAEVCDPGTKVVVVGAINDVHHYRALMSKGVADYLLTPLDADLAVNALDRLFSAPGSAPKGKVVSFWGARGGAGASSLAQNMAWLMGEQLEEPVLYIDCDISFGSSQVALGIDARQTVADAISHAERLDQVFLERSVVAHGDHLRVLAAPGDLKANAGVTLDAMDRLLDIARTMAPVVVLDLPRVWTDWTEHLIRMSSERLVVACPDFSSIKNVKSMIDTMGGGGPDGEMPIKLLLNCVDAYKRTQLSSKDFEDTLGLKPVLSIPFEPNLFGEASNRGMIASQTSPGHRVVKMMAGLVPTLCGRAVKAKAGNPWLPAFQWLRA